LSELHETIRGGERVLIRQVRPEDMALYPDFLRDVSAEDLRLRFFAHIADLSAAEIDKLAHLDYRHEMAFIALDEDTGHMLGLVRLKDELDEKTAEFAILVRSRLKGHGLGWQLMQRVIDYAKAKKVCGACMAMCWSKTPPCCKCASSSVSTRWTSDRASGALCSISRISGAGERPPFGALEKFDRDRNAARPSALMIE
jgi:GNAT superfamily N-acetyltransferase